MDLRFNRGNVMGFLAFLNRLAISIVVLTGTYLAFDTYEWYRQMFAYSGLFGIAYYIIWLFRK